MYNKPLKLQLCSSVQQPEENTFGQCSSVTTDMYTFWAVSIISTIRQNYTHSGQCPLMIRGIHILGSVQKCNSQTEASTFWVVSIVATTRQRNTHSGQCPIKQQPDRCLHISEQAVREFDFRNAKAFCQSHFWYK